MKALSFWRLASVVVVASVVLAGCDWPMFGFGPGHTGFNPLETKVGPSNVGALKEAWSAPGSGGSPATVVNGVAYVGGTDTPSLMALDANGTTNCSGSPKTCSPLWTASPGFEFFATPAVADGVVYDAGGNVYA